MAHLEDISVLVVEANQGMRAQLRTMLDSFNVTSVQFASSAGAAVRKLRERRFDLILCEYDLGEGQDGQHLLEDLRSAHIIPLETLFIMITAERSYERVVGAAELVPNDYILKPLTAGTLQQRLQRALDKREAFLPAYRLVGADDVPGAIAYCARAEAQHPRYRTDLLRLRAELLVDQGRMIEAESLYREVLASRPVPWARLGLARVLIAGRRLEEALPVLEALVAESAYYLDAYDLLARTRLELGQPEGARDILANAVQLSPHRVGRLRQFGEVSMTVGDYEAAEQVLGEVVRKSKYSDLRTPEDHVRLVRAQLARDRVAEAESTIRDLEKSMAGLPGTEACRGLSRALVSQRTGDAEGARAALQRAIGAGQQGADLSVELRQQLVRACLDAGLEAEGSDLAVEILRNAADEETIETTRSMLRLGGREALAEAIEERLLLEVKGYIATGAAKAKAGDYDGAVKEMMSAVRKMPGSPQVLFNAALALLRHIEHNGWNERFATQARSLIARSRRLDPANPRLTAITDFMQGLVERYGVRQSPAASGGQSPGLPG